MQPPETPPAVVVLEQPLTPAHVQDIADAASSDAAHAAAQAGALAATAHETAQESAAASVGHEERIAALESSITDRLSAMEARLDEWQNHLTSPPAEPVAPVPRAPTGSETPAESLSTAAEQDVETVDIVPVLPEDAAQPARKKRNRFLLRHPLSR
jgi:hypothetical protein